jgi:hypothetical protein
MLQYLLNFNTQTKWGLSGGLADTLYSAIASAIARYLKQGHKGITVGLWIDPTMLDRDRWIHLTNYYLVPHHGIQLSSLLHVINHASGHTQIAPHKQRSPCLYSHMNLAKLLINHYNKKTFIAMSPFF